MSRRTSRRTVLLGLIGGGFSACKDHKPEARSPNPVPSTVATKVIEPPSAKDISAPKASSTLLDGERSLPLEKSAQPSAETPKVIYLQPLGHDFAGDDLRFIDTTLRIFFATDVRIRPSVGLPKEAYYPPRARYRAEKLLDFLQSIEPQDSHVIMGLTNVDISTTKGPYPDWGILGLATVDGGQCVISRFRAKRDAHSESHVKQRLAKTVVHEVGHTLGLFHCPNFGCLMEDGKGSVKTSDHEYDLCSDCRSQRRNWVKPLPEAGPPWPHP